MRINPNRPENVRQAQALKEARQVMHSVDEVLELVRGPMMGLRIFGRGRAMC